MRILVTGASGLLGSHVAFQAEEDNFQVIKQCNRPRPGFFAADLTIRDGLDRVCHESWDWLIHCAACKDPELCESQPEQSRKINVEATAELATFAAAHDRKMLFISTDFVFDGTQAPYGEDAPINPLNMYGSQKAEAEQLVLAASPSHSILRVPILYGEKAGLDKSLLISSSLKVLNSQKSCWMDTRIVRYPTYTGDVARAALLILNKNGCGIYHISGQDKTSKFGICKLVADILGKSMAHIEARESDPNKEANRPPDAHLSMNRLLDLGFEIEQPLQERFAALLAQQ